jgi:CheY-like chemotaxis protein
VRILVVDDNQDALRTLAALLTLEKHTVTLTASAGPAIEAAAGSSFDVVLLDIKMPGVDGFQVADQIRTMTLPKQPLIIAVTVLTSITKRTLDEHGIDLHLAKPFTIEHLTTALQTLHPQ